LNASQSEREERKDMAEHITYPLDVALGISAVWGAILETEDGHRIRIDPIEDWAIWYDKQRVADAGGSGEEVLAWLKECNIPIDMGWLPELPVYVAGEESFVRIEDDRFESKE